MRRGVGLFILKKQVFSFCVRGARPHPFTNKNKMLMHSFLKKQDFGIMKGSGFGFDDLWGEGADANPLISEVATEKALNAQVRGCPSTQRNSIN